MRKPLKALLLAAGLGTRLRPLTYKVPKCLIEIESKPILEHWLEKLEQLDCESVLINTHYLADQVNLFLRNRKKSKMSIEVVYENKLRGTAGTLISNTDFFDNSSVLMIHADNYTNTELSLFLEAFYNKPHYCHLTMLTFTTKCPSDCGIVETNNDGILVNFHEKVPNPPCNCANGAIYLFDNSLIKEIKTLNKYSTDFSRDVLPFYKGMINTWHTDNIFVDIGTPKALKELRTYLSNNKC
tara:strand:+ start:91 stop:813 length:723 start_codon:yes stop_codon:yes gene_type:complete